MRLRLHIRTMRRFVNKLCGFSIQTDRTFGKIILCCVLAALAVYICLCLDSNSTTTLVYKYRNEERMFDTSWKPDLNVNFTWNTVLDSLQHIPGKGDFLQSGTVHFGSNLQRPSKSNKEPLSVFVLFHSHNDPGYLQTFDDYYFKRTRQILSLAVENLIKHPDLTFIWTDTCFLERWWNEQNNITREKFRHVVRTGQFEIALGAWVSADECVSHYFAYVDQLTEGYNWVVQHLNVYPNVSFNMDQFGSSASINYIRSTIGIKHSIVNHLHKGTKTYFREHQLLEFHSRQLWGETGCDDSFIHVEPFDNLAFRGSCGPSPSVCRGLDQRYLRLPGPRSVSFQLPKLFDGIPYKNVHHFAKELVKQMKLKSSGYLHNALLLPLGHDNTYFTASEWDNQYRNLKIIMEYINKNKMFNVNMKFGTLSQFFAEVNRQSANQDIKYPYVSGDLFPYTRGPKYWSGYFATRQFAKRLGRELQEAVRAADTLLAYIAFNEEGVDTDRNLKLVYPKLLQARRVLYIFQHHDAITGTSEEDVARDYRQQLASAFTWSQDILAHLVKHALIKNCSPKDPAGFDIHPVLIHENINELTKQTMVDIGDGGTQVVVYNSFAQKRLELITVLTNPKTYVHLSNSDGTPIDFDLETYGNVNKMTFVAELPPVSLSVFKLTTSNVVPSVQSDDSKYTKYRKVFQCENRELVVGYSLNDGSPLTLCLNGMRSCINFHISLIHYSPGSDVWTFPDKGKWKKITDYSNYRTFTGKHYCSIEFEYKYVRIRYLLHKGVGINEQRLEMEIHDNLSKGTTTNFVGDFAVRIETNINSKRVYYTDSNGLQLMERIYRPKLSFGANIYPMTSMAVIQDDMYRLTVHSAQPHGVVSRESGSLDIIVDRVVITEGDGTVRNFKGNTKDNSPTFTKLHFQLETKSNVGLSGSKEKLKPTIDSILLNDLVQHPLYSFYSKTELTCDKDKNALMHSPPPYEIVIANLKCLIGDSLQLNGLTLSLFHREVSNVNSQNLTMTFNPFALFSHRFKYIDYLFKAKHVSPNYKNMFNPMDLKTFVLK